MKILAIFKGFVTNSSSANYWLEDEDFKTENSTSTDNITEQKNNPQKPKENDLSEWNQPLSAREEEKIDDLFGKRPSKRSRPRQPMAD